MNLDNSLQYRNNATLALAITMGLCPRYSESVGIVSSYSYCRQSRAYLGNKLNRLTLSWFINIPLGAVKDCKCKNYEM